MAIDDTDKRIIDLLRRDGRMANNEMARQLDVSEGTIRNRLSRLTESGFLKVSGQVNPGMHTDCQFAVIGAKVAVSSDLRRAASQVAELPHVCSVTIVSGRYDLLIEVFLPNHELITFISDHLSTCESVVSTESFVALESIDKWV